MDVDQLFPRVLPMVVPPRPWTGPMQGGYMFLRNSIMRTHGSHLQTDALKVASMPLLYKGLNLLGKVPWRINNNVLRVVEAVWKDDGGVSSIASRINLTLPPKPDADAPKEAVWEWKKEVQRIKQHNANLHSQRCDFQWKLGVAQDFKSQEFFYPCNIDFRGRVYPLPPHLNHIGNDLCRGLMMFGKGEALGDRGLYWLRMQVLFVVIFSTPMLSTTLF
jgi:DNA-directed RNA polymerase